MSSGFYQTPSNPYGTQQASGQYVPQQHQRQSVSHTSLASTSPQVPSRGDYQEQSAYPTYSNAAPQAQQGYTDQYNNYLTPAQGNPAFPEPHSPAGGSLQRSHSGQSATHYPSASSSGQRSYSGQSATHYSSSSSSGQRSHSGQPTTHYPPSSSSSGQRSHSGQSSTLYAPAPSSVQQSYSGQSATQYPPASNSTQQIYRDPEQSSVYYPPTQTYDPTNTSYPGPQPTSSHHAVPHGHGTNTSDGSHSSNRGYAVAQAQPHHQDDYEYDNEGHLTERRPKSPGRGPVQGRRE
ncbi:hypothetical protein BJY52DRAFT_1188939 [Lactarius psammicola]|nr:hypothetical protein BJY52DRAFT_1188939 [Lactarius psammicola]